MRYLHFNEIRIENYDVIGFDMDGTLYNELCFIKQVYKRIAMLLHEHSSSHTFDRIYNWLVNRWKEKGSSYPFIFKEAIEMFVGNSGNSIVKECLYIYRNFKPNLKLNPEIGKTLETLINKNYSLFLVTDGNYVLQKTKFYSLGLIDWFKQDNVIFTGKLGEEYYKPNTKAINHISCLDESPKSVLYIGDREVDANFAINANFDFFMVDNFNRFWDVD